MRLQPFSYKTQSLCERYLGCREHELSAYAFENILLWQSLYTVSWAEEEGTLCVFFRDALGSFLYLPPLGDGNRPAAARRAHAVMEEINAGSGASRIENVEAADRQMLEEAGFVCKPKTNEYLCDRKSLVGLRGNAYKSKRSSLNQFLRLGEPTCRPISIHDRDECLSLYDRWQRQRLEVPRDSVYKGMLADSRRCLDGLFLGLGSSAWRGMAVRIGSDLKAFTIGYPMSTNTFCIFYEVADLEAKGCAQYTFQRFCADLDGYETINIMDDCGLPNLRRVKESYRPVRRAPNYTAVFHAHKENI